MAQSKSMAGHQNTTMVTDEWLTPPDIIKDLGPFDLDPCSPVNRPWDTATKHLTIEDNGLLHPWDGFVWLNPPYGKYLGPWLNRLVLHGNGLALIFSITGKKVFFTYVWDRATSLLFIKGRILFYNIDGNLSKTDGGAYSVLVAYGKEADKRLINCSLKGKYIKL